MKSLKGIITSTGRFFARLAGFKDATPAIIAWIDWTLEDRARIVYSEQADRMNWLLRPRGALPISTDCSGYSRLLYWLANCADIMKLGYKVLAGYTGTELSAEEHIAMLVKNARGVTVENIRRGDLCVYGAFPGKHVAVVYELGPDPLMASHGKPGDPSLVRHSVLLSLGAPTWLRCNTLTRNPVFPPTKVPTAAQIAGRGLVILTDSSQAQLALRNKWPLFVWNGYSFSEVLTGNPLTMPVYANYHFASPRG
jgi:hypothetical protein